jgi:DHA2 family multidrug resistance protein
MSTLAFATIPERFRTEASSMFSLMRNLGSSIGVSVVMAFLARYIQINHASLAALITPFRDAMSFAPKAWDWSTAAGAMTLNAEVTRQASMIAYVDDFQLCMWVTLAAIPLIALLRGPPRGRKLDTLAAAME